MKLIIGLGNPGKEYENTRHNVGFMAIDMLTKKFNINTDQMKFKGVYGTGLVNGEKVVLLKPLTYMNLSGESIRPLMEYYNIGIEDIVVIYDDLDLPVGRIRLRQKGSAGGHNGIKSTVQHLGTQEFNRIRIGIDRPQLPIPITNYVLGRFTKEEMPDIQESIQKSAEACEAWLNTPFLQVMNNFN